MIRTTVSFWWWLLDRSLDDRAWWAYHHRYDMDPARYQALVATDQQLQARVTELEAQQQVQRDPSYVPAGVDRDLMYSDQYVNRAYSNRRTTAGVLSFWLLAVPTAVGFLRLFHLADLVQALATLNLIEHRQPNLTPCNTIYPSTFLTDLVSTTAFGIVAILLIIIGYVAFDKLTPKLDFNDLLNKGNMALGVVVGSFILGLCYVWVRLYPRF